ncbi:MAG: response regulator transcription factor [Lachnospiraceae bacterium]|nr:response regulator transcription factor [Lachnospiraceae bacterium]
MVCCLGGNIEGEKSVLGLKIVICDDKKEDREQIRDNLYRMEAYKDAELKLCSPEELLAEIEADSFCYDIAIMDIEFKDSKVNGIDVVKLINSKYEQCVIIYISAILEFAPMVYESSHCYFVLKKNMDVTLELAMNKAVRLLEKQGVNDILNIISNGNMVMLKQRDIIYVERAQRTVKIGMSDRDYKCYKSLREISKLLSGDFVRCHRGFFVNMEHIRLVDKNELEMDNAVRIPIGDTYRDAFLEAYLSHCSMRI